MSQERDRTQAHRSASQERVIYSSYFIYSETPTGSFRGWSGLTSIPWDGETWLPMGDLVSISSTSESIDSRANDITVTFTGLKDDFFHPANLGDYKNSPVTIWHNLLNPDTLQVEHSRIYFKGFISSDSTSETPNSATLKMTLGSKMSDLLRKRPWKYSHQDQQTLYPGQNDNFLFYVGKLQELEEVEARA